MSSFWVCFAVRVGYWLISVLILQVSERWSNTESALGHSVIPGVKVSILHCFWVKLHSWSEFFCWRNIEGLWSSCIICISKPRERRETKCCSGIEQEQQPWPPSGASPSAHQRCPPSPPTPLSDRNAAPRPRSQIASFRKSELFSTKLQAVSVPPLQPVNTRASILLFARYADFQRKWRPESLLSFVMCKYIHGSLRTPLQIVLHPHFLLRGFIRTGWPPILTLSTRRSRKLN